MNLFHVVSLCFSSWQLLPVGTYSCLAISLPLSAVLECTSKLPEGRTVLVLSQLYGECLACNKHSINISWVQEWLSMWNKTGSRELGCVCSRSDHQPLSGPKPPTPPVSLQSCSLPHWQAGSSKKVKEEKKNEAQEGRMENLGSFSSHYSLFLAGVLAPLKDLAEKKKKPWRSSPTSPFNHQPQWLEKIKGENKSMC